MFAARQIVNHGHVLLNGKRCNIGSIIVKAGDVIQLREKAKQMPSILEGIGSIERDVPEYIEADHDKMNATFLRIPTLEEVTYPVQMEPNLVIEYYSRKGLDNRLTAYFSIARLMVSGAFFYAYFSNRALHYRSWGHLPAHLPGAYILFCVIFC